MSAKASNAATMAKFTRQRRQAKVSICFSIWSEKCRKEEAGCWWWL
ncbi:unnamed protein product [Linum tenue]|uniref:Uncharacterized protein n=1 Tax=Linum tenue TaxID=586396 RepID=A0AAV0MEK4_9ROSI|nr:unnamed protein product [Linum tenue]